MELFPDSPVSSLIEAYCRYFGYPLPSDETKVKRRRKDKDDQHAPETDSEIGTAVEASQRPDPFNVFVVSSLLLYLALTSLAFGVFDLEHDMSPRGKLPMTW